MRVNGAGTNGLAGATAAALGGANAAAAAFEASARTVVASGLPPPEVPAAPRPDAAAGAGLLAAQAAGGDGLLSGITGGTLARRAYQASLGVLRAADEMTGAALRLLR